MDPSLGCLGISVFRIREAHPADEDFPALLVTEALRGVEIEAMVQLLEIRGLPAAIGIRREPEDTVLVDVFILVSILRHALRTAEQENLLVQFEKHRALPHISEVFRGADHLPEGEIFQIVPAAFIDQGTAAGVPGPGTDHHVQAPVNVRNLRVPHMTGKTVRIVLVSQQDLFV